MKRNVSVILVLVLLFAISATALAQTTNFTNYVLKNGTNGKQSTAGVDKSTATGTKFNLTISSISGATSSYPIACNVYRTSTGNVASASLGQPYKLGSYNSSYAGTNGSAGVYGSNYFMKMQNTTGGPTITVTGSFTP